MELPLDPAWVGRAEDHDAVLAGSFPRALILPTKGAPLSNRTPSI